VSAFTAPLSAQTSPVLNKLDVQKLISSTATADQSRLAAHFTALADRKEAAAAAGMHEQLAGAGR
jgi:hypothetical protein